MPVFEHDGIIYTYEVREKGSHSYIFMVWEIIHNLRLIHFRTQKAFNLLP